MNFPRVIVPESHIEACRKWVAEITKPGARGEGSLSVSLHKGSAADPEVQLAGKLREVAVCLYYGLRPSAVLNLVAGQADHHDVPLGPLRIDVKGSEHALAELMPYSVRRTDARLYENARITHLLMVRDLEPDEFELCGWMTKQDFWERHLVAPDGHPKVVNWIPGTWYVPIEWLKPVEQLRSYRGPYHDHRQRFIHYCQYELCGKWGAHGYGTHLMGGTLGEYFCAEHKPEDTTQRSREL